MKGKKTALLVVLAAAVLAAACFDKLFVIPTQTQDDHSGAGASATPSPSPGAIARVIVTTFGDETCANGAAPADDPDSVRVGCEQPITCTPKLADGSNAPLVISGPTPDSFSVTQGNASLDLLATSEPFNKDGFGKSPGVARVTCVVKGVGGDLDITVLP